MTTDALHTLTRHWLLLRAIPRAPRKVDTATLERHLEAEGFGIHRRSIQRDLHQLSSVFPLVCDDRSRPYGWSWARDAQVVDLPAMDPRTAMTFRLVGRYLPHLLPRSTWKELEPHLDRANAVLQALDDHRLARWPEKVRVVPEAVPEQPPPIPDGVLDAVYEALLDDRVLAIRYRRRGALEARRLVAHPLGLVFRGPLAYLVCTTEPHPTPVTLALFRAEAAEVLEAPREAPEGFSLDAFVAEGQPGFLLSPGPVRVTARVHRKAALRLLEAPPGIDTEVQDDGEHHVLLRTTLPDTRPMRAWLLGFGEALEVLEPPELRAAIAAQVREAARLYD